MTFPRDLFVYRFVAARGRWVPGAAQVADTTFPEYQRTDSGDAARLSVSPGSTRTRRAEDADPVPASRRHPSQFPQTATPTPRPRRSDDAWAASGQLSSESRPMVSATTGRQSTHTTSAAECWGRAAFAASPTRPPANAAHADRTLNPHSARPRSRSSSRRSGRSNIAVKQVPPRSPNRQRAIRT
jgi:hypothetical protein